jgi:hypothetical protein
MINNPSIWGPSYWFFLHTICLNYPVNPNKMIKKKYYDLIMNFPLFIPNKDIADNFETILDKYPVNPYLDNRNSLIKWIHFIHNEINKMINKPTIEIHSFLDNYYDLYKINNNNIAVQFNYSNYIKVLFFILLIFLCYKLYTL